MPRCCEKSLIVLLLSWLVINCLGKETTTAIDPERYACPEGFKQLTIDWCFHLRFNSERRLNFKESQAYCKTKESILPAITSVDVTSALMLERTNQGISPLEPFYIGLGCNITHGSYPHTWMWIDGPEYDPSEAFFGSQGIDTEKCNRADPSFVFDQFGTWETSNQNNEQALTVCAQRPRGYSPPPVPINSPCVDSWTPLPGGLCYRLSSEPNMDIWDAEMLCRASGGHLPSIRSADQNNVIQGYLQGRSYQNSQFWLGLYCAWDEDYEEVIGRIGKRQWIDGSPYNSDDYSNFLDPDDNTDTCTVGLVDAFVYNGILKGKWQKQKFNWTVTTLLCAKPDPKANPVPPTTTEETTKTDEIATTFLTKTTSTEPETVESTIASASTTTSASEQPPTTSSTIRHTLVLTPMITLIYTIVYWHN